MRRAATAVVCLLAVAAVATGQEVAVPPAAGLAEAVLPPPKADPPATAAYTPGDGLTVSMLNDTTKLKLFANVSAIGAFNTSRPFPAGTPLFLLPPSSVGLSTNTFDLSARQTSLGAALSGPEVWGLKTGAYFLAFIQNDNLTSDAYGFLPFNAYGELKNDDWRFAAGLQSDVFNPVGPTMISLLNIFASGNAGSYRGQARVEHFWRPADGFQLTTQGAVSEPVSNIITDSRRFVEDNGWPNVEARVAGGFGAERGLAGGRTRRPVEVGVSGVVGQLRNSAAVVDPDRPVRSTVDVWGLGVDAQAAVTDRFGLLGEFFLGQSLGEYNGMVAQSFGKDLRAIRGAGGFGEAYLYLTDRLHVHAGYGVDAPVAGDLAASQIRRNQTYYASAFWDVTKTVQVSCEVDYRRTDYVSFRSADGVTFLTQFLWRF